MKLQKYAGGWVDVSDKIQSFTIFREGFRPELGEIRPGSAEVIILDTGGTLNTTVLDEGMPVRLMQGIHILITGTVDKLVYNNRPTASHFQVHVSIIEPDLLAQTILDSGYAATVARVATGLNYWYLPLDDPPDQTYPRDHAKPGVANAAWVGPLPTEIDVIPSCPGGKNFNLRTAHLILPDMVNSGAGKWTLSFVAGFPVLDDVFAYLFLSNVSTASLGALQLEHRSAMSGGSLITYLAIGQQGSGGLVYRTATVPNDGGIHHYVLEGTPGAAIRVWVDGSEMPIGPFSTNTAGTVALNTTVDHYIGANTSTVALGAVQIGHIFQLGDALVLGYLLYIVSITGNVNPLPTWDTAKQRVEWLLAKAGVAFNVQNFTTLVRGVRGQETAAEHLDIMADSTGAMAFFNINGGVEFKLPETAITYAIGTEHEPPFSWTRDRARIVDSCIALSPSGVRMGLVGNGGRQMKLTVLNLYPADAQARCQDVVNNSASGKISIETLTLRPAKGNRWDQILPLDLSKLVSFMYYGSTYKGTIEGIKHQCSGHLSEWTTVLHLGPLTVV